MRFEWDEAKAEQNLRKHGISFDEAALVFSDPLATIESDEYIGNERRWRTTGLLESETVILVIHLLWEEDYHEESREVIRIISARAADAREKRIYERKARDL